MKKGLLLTLLITTIFTLSACTAEEEAAMDDMADEMMEEEMMEDKEAEMEKAEEAASAGGAMYEEYTAQKRTDLAGKPHLVFFHAEWCSTCLKKEETIKGNLADLPEVTVLQANFDGEDELKKELGVTMQSTVIAFDSDGNEVRRTQGALTLEQIKQLMMEAAA